MFAANLSTAIGLLAQDGAPPEGPGLFQLAMPIVMIVALYYMMFVLPQKSRDKRLEELADNLKVNDHVITTGGIYGVVTSVQKDENRVTLRIDESTGAKMRVTLETIGRVLDDKKDKSDEKAK